MAHVKRRSDIDRYALPAAEPVAPVDASTLFVTAKHRTRSWEDSGGTWVPFATHHARRPGDLVTLCGVSAVEWRIFWDLRFSSTDARSCED